MCWVIWVVIIPETLQKELSSELLNGNCYPGLVFQSKNTTTQQLLTTHSPPGAMNTVLAVGLLSPAETTTHSPLQECVSPVPAGVKPNRAHPHPRGPPQCSGPSTSSHLFPISRPSRCSTDSRDTLSFRGLFWECLAF